MIKKVLIIRFSSFGDVLQTLSVAGRIGLEWPEAEIHWVTRSEFTPLIQDHPNVFKVWSLEKKNGLTGLIYLAKILKRQNFTHIYDAHNNLRSRFLSILLGGILFWKRVVGAQTLLRRPIYRFKRFLLFRFKINLFPQPFNGQAALLKPLKAWGLSTEAPGLPQLYLKSTPKQDEPTDSNQSTIELLELPKQFIALAPSAAFFLKRWPIEHFKKLIRLLPDNSFVILGGPDDTFCEELHQLDPTRVLNLSGKLTLLQSSKVVAKAQLLIANDTGLMHVAEQTGIPCIALMGPAPFGFPSRPMTRVLEISLPCRPCSKHGQGPCINPEFHKCMKDIRPELVASEARHLLGFDHAHVST